MEVINELQMANPCGSVGLKISIKAKKKEFNKEARMQCFYCSRRGYYERECSMYLEDKAKGREISTSGIFFINYT